MEREIQIGDLVYYNTRRNPILRGFLGTVVAWAPTQECEVNDWVLTARVHWFAFNGPSIVELDELELAQNA